MTKPTDRDLQNARLRQAIAGRQQAAYDRVCRWAASKFGAGWLPSGRHYLLDKTIEADARRTGQRPVAAATCYSVRNAEGRTRHFTVKDEQVTEHVDYQEAFGSMLLEAHPTLRIEVKGHFVAPHRFNLCWAPLETYAPRTAEQLAATRVTRERNKAKTAEKKWAKDNPLFADLKEQEKETGRDR
jgi:hypothetical protein